MLLKRENRVSTLHGSICLLKLCPLKCYVVSHEFLLCCSCYDVSHECLAFLKTISSIQCFSSVLQLPKNEGSRPQQRIWNDTFIGYLCNFTAAEGIAFPLVFQGVFVCVCETFNINCPTKHKILVSTSPLYDARNGIALKVIEMDAHFS